MMKSKWSIMTNGVGGCVSASWAGRTETYRDTERQTDRQTDRQRDIGTEGQRDRETERQRDISIV